MKYKVLIDPQAKKDLKEIFIYVAINDGFDAANKLFDAIEKHFINWKNYPNADIFQLNYGRRD